MSDLASIHSDGTLNFIRRLPGPIERVWAYLTDPTFLAKWFSEGAVADYVGGDVRFEMGANGRITAIHPPRLLEYTWNEADASVGPVSDALVRWELANEGDRVRLTLTHSRLPEAEVFAHAAGWHAFLERLSASVGNREAEPVMELFARFKADYAPMVQAAGFSIPS
jgi:uncharacterized protein YndB with AHSA1/START domain